MHTCTHAHACTRMHTLAHRHMHAHMYTHAHAGMCAHMHTQAYACTHVHPFISKHRHTHARTHIHTCTHRHKHACTYTHVRPCPRMHVCTFTHTCTHMHLPCSQHCTHTQITHGCLPGPTMGPKPPTSTCSGRAVGSGPAQSVGPGWPCTPLSVTAALRSPQVGQRKTGRRWQCPEVVLGLGPSPA